jgi:hypothetical protein
MDLRVGLPEAWRFARVCEKAKARVKTTARPIAQTLELDPTRCSRLNQDEIREIKVLPVPS